MPPRSQLLPRLLALILAVMAAPLALLQGEPPSEPVTVGIDLGSDLLGWWRLDDITGPTVPDSSGNGFTGQLSGDARSEPAPQATGQALPFDGESTLIEIAAIVPHLEGAQELTIALWVRAGQLGTDRGFVSGAPESRNDHGLSFRYDASGRLGGGTEGILASLGRGRRSVESIGGLQSTEWQHLAMTWVRGEPIAIWVDGSRVALSAEGRPWNRPLSGLTTFLIGRGRMKSPPWEGWLRDVRVYRRSLSAEEITLLSDPDWLSVPDGATSLERVSGDRQGPEDGTFARRPLLARVLDPDGRPVRGESVTFSTARGPYLSPDGAALAAECTVPTDQNGIARILVRQPDRNQRPFTVEATAPWTSDAITFTVRPWGLIGHWTFEHADGDRIPDESGNALHGFLRNGAGLLPAPVGAGYALSLDGVDDWMEAPGVAAQLEGRWAMTLNLWIRSDEVDTDRGFLTDKPPYRGDHRGLMFRYDRFGWRGRAHATLKGAVRTTWRSAAVVQSAAGVQATDWQNWTFVWRTRGPLEVYLNGFRLPDSWQRTIRGTPIGGNLDNLESFFLGRGSRETKPWLGQIGEVRLYDRALPPEEIARTWQTSPSDRDGDGLPDSWELEQHGSLFQTAADDADHDATPNAEAYLASLPDGSPPGTTFALTPGPATAREPDSTRTDPARWPPAHATTLTIERDGDPSLPALLKLPHRGSARLFLTRSENGDPLMTGDWQLGIDSGSFLQSRSEILARFLPGQTHLLLVLAPTDDLLSEGTEELGLFLETPPDPNDLSLPPDWRITFDDNQRFDDTDADHDSLPDRWERIHLGSLSPNPDQDPDADTLLNADEASHGTLPGALGADTDRDSLPDAWELEHQTNPLKHDALEDPDQDGLSNAQEHQRGSDPNDPDSGPDDNPGPIPNRQPDLRLFTPLEP